MIMPFIRLVTIYVVVILAVVTFFNRDRLMELAGVSSDETGQSTPLAVEATTGEQDRTTEAPQPGQSQPAAEATPTAAVAKVEATVPAPVATPVAAPQAAAAPETRDSPPQPTAPPIVRPTADPDLAQSNATSVEAAPLAAPTAAASDDAAGGFETRLDTARRAFWEGDLEQAEALFAALAAEAPDNADVNGELGNVYFAQRRFEDAAAAYLAAGKVLAASGQQARAMQLVNVLQSMSPDHAAELHATMNN